MIRKASYNPFRKLRSYFAWESTFVPYGHYAMAQIKIPKNTEAQKKTLTYALTLRIKNETKFLYKKKQQINTLLYYIHNVNTWQQTWISIEQSINLKLLK